MRIKDLRPSKNYEDRRQPYSTLGDHMMDQLYRQAMEDGRQVPDVGYRDERFQQDKVSRWDKIQDNDPISNYTQKSDFNDGKTNKLPVRRSYNSINDALKNMGVLKKSRGKGK